MTIERRTFLKSSAAVTLLGGPFAGFVNAPADAWVAQRAAATELIPVKDKRDGKVRLHLPKGFSYRSFHDKHNPVTLTDGTKIPGNHDGMGAFPARKNTIWLVRNHEINGPVGRFARGPVYDPAAGGGTTSIRVTKRGRPLRSFTSLSGTMMNCSGGIMPWGSWITCEETVNGPDVGPDFTGASNVPLKKPHGYIFEVPKRGESNHEPITRAGRFAHEAVSFDPEGGALYLTEDNFGFASGFYRYTPRRHPRRVGHLDNRGVLEMLKVKGERNIHLEGRQRQGVTYDVEWVEIDEPDKVFPYTPGQEPETTNNEAIVFVGNQGRAQGAALFSRLEGQVFDNGVVYFTSTQGGGEPETSDGPISDGFGNGFGQIWGYDTREQTLTCVFQSPGQRVLDFPDNVTTSPRGTLVICEDSEGNNFLRGLSQDGKLFNIALNRIKGMREAEFAGSTFSRDGRTLYVNIQDELGMSFAIWGPWRSIGV